MHRHALSCLSLLVLLATAGPAASGDAAEGPPRTPLRGLDCLDPDQVRQWDLQADDTLLVDAGRRKYRVQVEPACVELGHAGSLRFIAAGGAGRVCGHLGDAVQVPGRSCRIDRIEILDADAWRELRRPAEATGEVRARATGD